MTFVASSTPANKSEIRWLQAIGRGLRTAPGKESCLIFDHSGTVHRLGYPDSIEYDDLPGKSDGMEESARRAAEERAEKLPMNVLNATT